MMQSWKHAAENLTAHYQEVSHGAMPFHENWVLEAQQVANMSDEDLDFLDRLKGLVEPRGMHYLRQATSMTAADKLRQVRNFAGLRRASQDTRYSGYLLSSSLSRSVR